MWRAQAYCGNLREHSRQPRSSSAHKPPLVQGNYLEGVWLKKGGTHVGISSISREKTANAYPAIQGTSEVTTVCLLVFSIITLF